MIKEFEGKTEKEAIAKAIEELGIDQQEFDIEVIENTKKGLFFKKSSVKIRVHIDDNDTKTAVAPSRKSRPEKYSDEKYSDVPIDEEFENESIDFLSQLIYKMGFPGKVECTRKRGGKLHLGIDSQYSSIIIGKRGKNLDALQFLLNVHMGRKRKEDQRIKIIIDTENYRERREENLVRMAGRIAEQVRESRTSRLLEPMNPFERRLIHTALNTHVDIDTESEGEGLYKQVRVMYKAE